MDAITNMIIASIETIFDDNGVYRADETSHEELLTFVNSLNRAQLSKIEQYIAQSPKLEHNIKFKCVKCKKDNDMTLSGIQSFFE
jgi:hypothetical protein